MAKKQEEEVKEGLPAWMGTYGDMVTLLLCFFVLLFSMSSVDVRKFKEAMSSFNNQIDVLPGGKALSEGERINNGTSQLNNIEILVDKALQQGEGESEGDDEGNPEDLTEEQLKELQLEKAKEVAENIDQFMQDKGIEEEIEIKYSLNYVKLTLPGETLFGSGQATLKRDAYDVADAIGQIINEEKFADFSMQIEGHTDNVPINTSYFPSNWELSAARAIAVGKYIIEAQGIDPTKIVTAGYGEYVPIAPNDTPENKAKNRRVEVKIVLQTEEVDLKEYDLETNTINTANNEAVEEGTVEATTPTETP